MQRNINGECDCSIVEIDINQFDSKMETFLITSQVVMIDKTNYSSFSKML